jgi:DNA-binding MarR family transcriptional regulator
MIIEQASDAFPEVQLISKLLFGNQNRLVVAAAIAEAEPGTIYARHIAESIGIVDAYVGPQLAVFEKAGLLVRLPKIGGERIVYFERRDSSFWELCRAVCQDILDATAKR